MSFLGDLFTGVAKGLVTSASGRMQSNAGIREVESLCNQAGLNIDERLDDNGLVLNFRDPLVGTRPLLITGGTTGKMAILSVASLASFAPCDLPADMGYYLLLRNKEGVFHSWQLSENSSGEIGFIACYCALVEGLDSVMFKTICEALLKEVHEVDKGLRSKGYI